MTRWYQSRWFYIEGPFPWVPILAVAVPVVLIALAVALGILW